MSALNDRQRRFCEEYVIDLNATQSAIRAGYSEKTANRIGSQNLSKVDIQKYIQQLQDAKAKEINITLNDILELEWSIAENGERDGDRLKATDQISKKLGFYAPEKIDHTSNGQVIQFQLPDNKR